MLKRVPLVLLIVLVVLSPAIFLSSPSLNLVVSYIDRNKTKPWAPDRLMTIASIFHQTFRAERAGELYKKFMEWFPPENHRYPEAKFYYAVCVAEDKARKNEAVKEFDEFMEWYPDHPWKNEAEKRKNNLLYGFFK